MKLHHLDNGTNIVSSGNLTIEMKGVEQLEQIDLDTLTEAERAEVTKNRNSYKVQKVKGRPTLQKKPVI